MTPRRAATLAVHLPFGAMTWIAAGSDAGWSSESHLLAAAIDTLRWANWQRGGDDKAPKPEPIMRPSGVAEQAAQVNRHEARAQAFLERRRRRQEQQTIPDE